MDFGVYELKYALRRKLRILLPFLKNVSPNTISLSLIPIGLLTALLYYCAPQTPHFYLFGLFFIVLRMIVGTLDGMLAEELNKASAKGAIINRLSPELCDLLLMGAIAISMPQHAFLAIVTLIIGHLTSFLGLIGLVGGKGVQSVGPVGQTDRLVALIIFSFLAIIWSNAMFVFFIWCILGGIVTCTIRLKRVLEL